MILFPIAQWMSQLPLLFAHWTDSCVCKIASLLKLWCAYCMHASYNSLMQLRVAPVLDSTCTIILNWVLCYNVQFQGLLKYIWGRVGALWRHHQIHLPSPRIDRTISPAISRKPKFSKYILPFDLCFTIFKVSFH